MAFKWDVPPTEVFPQGYRNYTQALFVTGRRVAEARAEEAEQWMKQNAPWQDRTGAARAGLHVDVNQAPAVLAELTFAHGEDVPYGIWLEIANGGRWGIISKSVDYWGPKLMQDVQRIVNLGLAAK
jgi:hypothetical protein